MSRSAGPLPMRSALANVPVTCRRMLLSLLSWWVWLLFEPLSLVLALLPTPSPAPPSKQVTTVTLRDGRKLAYEVRGSLERRNKVFWNHGIISSR